MDCNKDEGIKAKTISEKKFADKDYAGAKKLALKAQTLYPGLNGIRRMLSTLDVYICYEKKVNGESDWYGILNVKPSDDKETIREQYRKLLLILHPDKNKSVGAKDAFIIVHEAWTLLSDNTKRAEYNNKLNPKVSSPNERHSSHTASPAPNPNPATTPAPAPAPAPALVDQGIYLFWTSCNRCKSPHLYNRMYVNQFIQCRYCFITFTAAEMPVPMNTIPPIGSSFYAVPMYAFPPTQPTGSWAASQFGANRLM